MSDQNLSLDLQQRDVLGKGLGQIRAGGMVPAVIHNHGDESVHVMAPEVVMEKIFKAAGKHHPLDLKVGDKKFLALIKDVQFNPVKHKMQHMVFQAIRQNETVEAEVPVRLEGDIPAEKTGLMVLHQLDTVLVEALPRNLPEELVADAGKLVELHDKVTVADLPVPSGVTILTEPEHPIASVVETRAQMSEEAEAEEAEAEDSEAGQAPEGTEAEAAGE